MTPVFFKDVPEAFMVRKEKWLLYPQHHVFGSEELSANANGISQLSPEPYIGMSVSDADLLGVVDGSLLTIKIFEQTYELPVRTNASVPNGVALMLSRAAGHAGDELECVDTVYECEVVRT